MDSVMSQEEKIKRGAEDSGRYFRHMMQFVGFTSQDALAIRDSGLVIEKHIPSIVSSFYANLLRYPPTRKFFLRRDGTLDQDYVQKRMQHLTNFWRRTAAGEYDDEYARYVDYVGRAHTAHGADPNIYIAERYVIGQVGFMQHAISQAITSELHDFDPELELRAVPAWNKLMMVILEMLSRAYSGEHEVEFLAPSESVDGEAVHRLAIKAYEVGLGIARERKSKEVLVGKVADIPEGERVIVNVGELSIGVFHHKGNWYALRNHCVHVGGPVATGSLEEDTLTCPWHGFQYNVTNGELLFDPSIKLEMYAVEIRGDQVFLGIVEPVYDSVELVSGEAPGSQERLDLEENEFQVSRVAPGQTTLVRVEDEDVAIFNVGGEFFATQARCTHASGPLYEGILDGEVIQCPIHGARFNVKTGEVLQGPARFPLETYGVEVDGDVGRVVTLE